MKPGVAVSDVVRNEIDYLDQQSVRGGLPFRGRIYASSPPANPPRWQKFVQSGTTERLSSLLSRSASALVVLEFNRRVFAVAFGFGRHWINERHIVRRFGMTVTLNVVHPERIRTIDREEFDTIQRKTRSQTSVRSSIDNFGLNIQRDLVRSVTGEPEDQNFARHVTGADNLILSAPVTFDQLGDKCGEALAQFERTRYRDLYPWIDNFTRVEDPEKIAELDGALVRALNAGELESIFLTPPDTLDIQEHRGFRYPNERRADDLHDDLRIEELLGSVGTEDITVESLKRWRIKEYAADQETPSRKYPVYDSILYEVTQGQNLYVLSFGEWFRISQDHVAEVQAQLGQIPDLQAPRLTDGRPNETEGQYNRRIAQASNGELALLDGNNVNYGGGHSSIEICDLLSIARTFIHVKAKTKSSTLSHLFAQGLNSAQAFRDARFRELAAAQCPPSHRGIFQGDPRPSDHTVAYAIITSAPGDLRNALPFFSKQSLANAAVALRNMGYQVRLKKIVLR